MKREPSFAGSFYSENTQVLKDFFSEADAVQNKTDAYGMIVPHAGYMYSGNTALKAFSRVNVKKRCIILGVNHREFRDDILIDSHSEWGTPLGSVPLDKSGAERLFAKGGFAMNNHSGLTEHSIEVIVPFIKYFNPKASIIPVLVSCSDKNSLFKAADKIADTFSEEDTLVIASSDMSHFISADEAASADAYAVKKIESLDPQGLLAVVREKRISMCGVLTTACLLRAARKKGFLRAEIVDYSNSGSATGDYNSVVAYLSALIL